MQPFSENQRPDLLTALMNMSLVLRLPWKIHLCRSSSNVPRLPSFLEMRQPPYVLLTFSKVHNPLRLPRETTSERPKVVRTCSVFNRRFSEPTCRPSGGTNHWKKHSVSRLSYLFARLDLLSSETFSFLIFFLLSSFFFSSLLFSALLCSARLVSSLLFSSLLFSSLLFSSLLFSSLTLPISAFHLSIWSEV